MKAEEIKQLEGNHVKLVLDNDYILRGTIEQVNEDSIFFRTNQTCSYYRLDAIKGIVLIDKK